MMRLSLIVLPLAFLLSAPLSAQVITVPELSTGEEATIEYDDPERSGEEIEIDVENAEGEPEVITITLDDSGHGEAPWTPPQGWGDATFSDGRAEDVSRVIQS